MNKFEKYLAELNEFTDSIDFESNDLEEIKKFVPIVSKILGVESLSTYVMNVDTENLVLTRCRKNKGRGILYENTAELNYPKAEYVNLHGRANVWNQSRFYASDRPGTSLYEVRPNNDWISSIDLRITKPSLKMLAVNPNSKYLLKTQTNFTDAEKAFNKYLSERFMAQIPPEKHFLYLPSAILTNLLIQDVDGIVFPSVASNLKGENFVLKPELIDKYSQIIETRVQETYRHKSPFEFKTKCLYVSNEFSRSGEIIWKPLNCNGHKIDESIYH
ncbi:RES domain-containing protein [Crocinitomix algicola]|uniref:RES domain-containing protein n=1 Tax=Crocinitomix algicola TaxID=1740263 RepID=UPI000837058B|nr:RES domain-containing protein [Crocinitomix algicola]